MIISQTPVRISFFGGGSDFPEYFEKNPASVLSTSINKYAYLTVGYLSGFFDYRIKVTYSKSETVSRVSEIRHPAVRACLEHMGIEANIEINYFSDLPARTGLGTSSSFVVGLLNALHAYQGRRVSTRQLAREAVLVERELVGENVGCQDQYAAAFGGFNYISFRPEGDIRVEPVVCPPGRLEALDGNLMLFYTGIQRYSEDIQKHHVARLSDNTAHLARMVGLAKRALEVVGSEREDLDEFGRLLHEGWELKKSLGTRISNPEIDAMYSAARSAGALGGKLLGAGGGGFLLLYAGEKNRDSVREALKNRLEVDFRFERYGSHIIFFDPDKLGHPGAKG